jgi:peptide/nickel transport system ATP-binding protein
VSAPMALDSSAARAEPLLEVADLSIFFTTPAGEVCAARELSFTLRAGEIVGLVGESGSGKTVTGMALLGLLPPHSSRVAGRASLAGRELIAGGQARLSKIRGNDISMIFQDPLAALDPVFTVEKQIVETIRAHQKVSRSEARRRAVTLLDDVGIPHASERIKDYPHQLSGGMRQRVMAAIALACGPKLLIADEPTTALDVTIQAQILDLLRSLSAEHDMAVLLISHDLGVVAEACSRVMTMYAGEIVEECSVDDALDKPLHPYTSGLMQAIPRAADGRQKLISIPGRVPALDQMPPGCHFGPRCAHAQPRCAEEHPALWAPEPSRQVRCVRAEELHLPGAAEAISGVAVTGSADR